MSSKTSWTSTGQDARAVVCFLRQWYIYWLRYNFFNCIQDLAAAILYNHQHGHDHHHHHRLEYDFVGCILGIVVTDRLPMWQFKPNQYSDSCVLPFPCIHNKYIGLHLICMHWNTGICCYLQKYDHKWMQYYQCYLCYICTYSHSGVMCIGAFAQCTFSLV